MKTMTKTAVALGTLLMMMGNWPALAADPPSDGKLIRNIPWKEVPLPRGTSLSKDGTTLIAEHGEAKPVIFSLLTLDNPGVHAKAYALRSSVRHSGVEGAGYLETWNSFSSEEGKPDIRAFSRTMGNGGAMSKITGNAEWRPAVLPFNAEGTKGDLKKLELNLFLSGIGKVEIKDLQLIEFADAAAMWQYLQRVTDAMLAPPAQPTKASTGARSKGWTDGMFSKVLWAAALLVILGVGAVLWKKRRDAERRRMKALDAM